MNYESKITQAIETLISATKANEKLDDVYLYLCEEYSDVDAEQFADKDLIRYAICRYEHLERSDQ